MKKYFPIIIITIFILTVSALREVLVFSDTTAMHISKESVKADFYNRVFQDAQIDFPTKSIKLSEIKEQIVIISFWASWSDPSIINLNNLVELGRKHKKKIKIISINTDDDKSEIELNQLQERFGDSLEITLDENGHLVDIFKVSSVPFTLIYSKNNLVQISQNDSSIEMNSLLNLLANK